MLVGTAYLCKLSNNNLPCATTLTRIKGGQRYSGDVGCDSSLGCGVHMLTIMIVDSFAVLRGIMRETVQIKVCECAGRI